MPPPPSQYAQSPEALVVGLARTGDQEAFEELVCRRQSWVRNLMRRLSSDVVLADDLAQQVFLKVWQDLPKLRHPQKFAGWLKRITINTWYQHLRKNDPLRELDTMTEQHVPHSMSGTADMGLDLDRALATLSNIVRLCVVLAYQENLSHSEIAHLTDLPLGTVKSHIRRGGQQLQTLLAAYQNEAET